MLENFAIAIMAAGKGTRLKSRRPKVLHEIGGRALLLHVIAAAKQIVGAEQIYVIIGHEADLVRKAAEPSGVNFVLQTEQLGTGHALQVLKTYLSASPKPPPDNLLVLSGDVPLIRAETLSALCDMHLRDQAAMTILTAAPDDPTGYGRVIRVTSDAPTVSAIVEQKALTPQQQECREINSGIYCFRTLPLFHQLDSLSPNNVHGEFYLTDVAVKLVAKGERVVALRAENSDEVLGANTIAEMMYLDQTNRYASARRLMAQGVTIFRPDTCVIDADVIVGPDTVIEPYVQLLGSTLIGTNNRIRSYSVIQDSKVGSGVLIRNGCILDKAEVGDYAIIGPYAHLRPESFIGDYAHIGNFVETKKVSFGKRSKANHLNYLGDAIVGEGVNIGAGAITCNYDGQAKHVTHVGDGAFIGSDSTLVAPLTIAEGAYIAAGSCITDNVPPGSLALARSRQVTKEGWATRRSAKSLPDQTVK